MNLRPQVVTLTAPAGAVVTSPAIPNDANAEISFQLVETNFFVAPVSRNGIVNGMQEAQVMMLYTFSRVVPVPEATADAGNAVPFPSPARA